MEQRIMNKHFYLKKCLHNLDSKIKLKIYFNFDDNSLKNKQKFLNFAAFLVVA